MSAPTFRYIVGTTAGHLTGLLGLRALINNHFGPYPIASVDAQTGQPVSIYPTKHHVNALPHPTVAGTYMFPMSAAVKAHVDVVIAACVSKVSAGTATAVETAIANLPAQIAALDATWSTVPNTGGGSGQPG